MGATFNPAYAGGPVASALGPVAFSGYGPVMSAQFFAGARPADPTISTGITALSAVKTIASGTWMVSSNGVAALASHIGFPVTANGSLSFIRFYTATNQPILDVDVGLVASGEKAIVSTLTATSGQVINLQDMRFRVATSGDTCVSPSVANEIVNTWANNLNATVSYSFSSLSGFSKHNPEVGDYTKTVTVEAWDGPIPANSTATPAGVKLWSKSITGDNLFQVSGMAAALMQNQTANAIASGTPTFVRAVKAAYSTIPATSMQAPVSALNGVQFANADMVSGASNTLTNFTVTFQA
jgi:hypothetical protein